MILNLYGGIYVDGDVLFLRDMSLFWTENFAYRWSQLETWNTAVLGLNKT
jgi:WD repeat and SOF domain-containing protein 1